MFQETVQSWWSSVTAQTVGGLAAAGVIAAITWWWHKRSKEQEMFDPKFDEIFPADPKPETNWGEAFKRALQELSIAYPDTKITLISHDIRNGMATLRVEIERKSRKKTSIALLVSPSGETHAAREIKPIDLERQG